MAITAGTVFPITPAGGDGGLASGSQLVCPLDPAQVVQAGDILLIDGTTKDLVVANADPAGTSLIYGVAMASGGGFTAASTIDRDQEGVSTDSAGSRHTLNVALALPGEKFTGNVVQTATVDETGVYQDNINTQMSIVQADVTAPTTTDFAALDQPAAGTNCVHALYYTSPQFLTGGSPELWQYGRLAGVGIANPRMTFYFLVDATVWGS